MEPTRRALLLGGSTVLAASLAGLGALPPAFANAPPADALAIKALNRLTFGATLTSVSIFKEKGFEAWLDWQLSLRSDDDATRAQLGKAFIPISYEDGKDENGNSWKGTDEPKRPLKWLDAAAADCVKLNQWDIGFEYSERERPARETQLATLIRAVHGEAQIHEVMTQFWHEHFSVNSTKDAGCSAYFVLHDRLIRAEALGNFRKLLGSAAKSPSMLAYLNNKESRASPANENYARELLELHTLGEINYLNDKHKDWKGVPGAKEGLAAGYIDQDVYETARAFTGWSIGDGGDLGDHGTLPRTGEFHYIDAWHDPYQKRILGREFPANAPPMRDGEDVLDMLAAHPGTARFIAMKLCRRLVADEPPRALVEQVADHFLSHKDDPDQIAKTIRLIALSDTFRDLPPTKMKRPFEFLVSLYRACGASIITTGGAIDLLARAGWRVHEWRPPTGHPDVASYWANTNTLATTTAIAINAFEEWFKTATIDLDGAPPPDQRKVGRLAEVWSRRLLVAEPEPAFVEALAATLGHPEDPLAEDSEGRHWQARSLIALAALTPEFMTR
jgi:uncharacterized protein (DUF1800 family)